MEKGLARRDNKLVSSLRKLGLKIPPEITNIHHLTVNPSHLYSLCSQSLNKLNLTSLPHHHLPPSLPDLVSDRARVCADLANAFMTLGFHLTPHAHAGDGNYDDATFLKFLFPSEEDTYKLVRFLVDKLSESCEASKATDLADNMGPVTLGTNYHSILTTLMKEVTLHEADGDNQKGAILREGRSVSDAHESSSCGSDVHPSEGGLLSERSKAKHTSDHESCSALKDAEKNLEFHHSREHDLLKEEMPTVLDKGHSLSHYIEQLNRQIQSTRQKLKELENQWNDSRIALEDQRLFLLESLCATNPEAESKLQKLKKVEQETVSVISEIRRRETECVYLALDLAKHPKAASRRSYIQRIAEISRNSRKLDADIEHILKETRELKLESNSIEERLHRTYAVVDETVLREAKKDPIGGRAHKLLRSIHESFEEIREKVLATDKAQREVAELEAKISKFDSRSLDIDEIQVALDALRMENELLERNMQS